MSLFLNNKIHCFNALVNSYTPQEDMTCWDTLVAMVTACAAILVHCGKHLFVYLMYLFLSLEDQLCLVIIKTISIILKQSFLK